MEDHCAATKLDIFALQADTLQASTRITAHLPLKQYIAPGSVTLRNATLHSCRLFVG